MTVKTETDMKIEEAIQQKRPFRNAWHKAAVNLIYTNVWLTHSIRELLSPYGITMQQYNVLRVLKGAGKPISTSIIRERMLDKMSDTSRMVERLHLKGLVCRNECGRDKRLVDVSLTPEGEALVESLKAINTEMDALLRNLTKEEAEMLSNLLDKARRD
jgi:DNA-binding MarR family transcriptional regulator